MAKNKTGNKSNSEGYISFLHIYSSKRYRSIKHENYTAIWIYHPAPAWAMLSTLYKDL